MKKNSKQRLLEVMQRVDPTFKPKLNESGGRNEFLRSNIPVDEIRSKLANQKYNDELMIDYKDIQNSLPGDFELDQFSANIFVYAFDENANVSEVITLFETEPIKLSQPFDLLADALNKGKWYELEAIMRYLNMDASFIGRTEPPNKYYYPHFDPETKAKLHKWVEEYIDSDTGEKGSVKRGTATFPSGRESEVYWDKQGKMQKPTQELNEAEGNEIDIKLDFPKNTSSINAEGQDIANNFPLTEEGLYNALYNIYTAAGKRYYNLINVAYVNPRGRSGQYEMDIMLPDRQNRDYVIKDMKDNITELFIEINDDGDDKGGPPPPPPGAEKQNFREGKKNNKGRLFEVMGHLDKTFKSRLNEGDAFNDAGEPRMTASQFRAYSEPSEPEYDDSRDDGPPAYEAADSVIVPKIEKHFNTALNVYRNKNLIYYGFVLKTNNPIGKCTMQIVFDGDMVDASRPDCKEFNGQGHYEDIDIEELFDFFEPYREYIVTPHENAIKKIQNALNHARDY
jgi:hypothetical protein